MIHLTAWTLSITIAFSLVATAQDSARPDSTGKIDSGTISSIKFREIGPALMSGRISDIAVDPVQPNTWYVAAGSGNLWKTVNSGTTWTPIFDHYTSYSIGCVTIDPSNHNTVWVGTGEAVGGRHVGFGDGVYVSHDAGGSFKKMGLEESEHLSKIVVDPRDSKVVYVASQGPLWSSGGHRGLYKTTDGGKSWKLALAKGSYTGVTDVVLDPRDPDVVYAATHQRHRTVAALMNGGPESGIHQSTDGGASWTELKNGLPGGDKGKIALALSPQNPDVVYATVELPGPSGGFWRSDNRGAAWTKQSDYSGGGTGPHYYQEIWADPHRAGVLYQANPQLGRTEDGGVTWNSVGNQNKHVDNHAVAFHPTDPDFLLVGCDGGLYNSHDYAKTYEFTENLPLTQFYKVDVDYDWPVYHVAGGTQDNNSQYGPTRTLSRNGIRNADWQVTIGGDGHDGAIDPTDPNIVYGESQQGYIRRWDRKTGETVDVRPQPEKGEENFRFNWDAPILISPHSNTRVYFASNKLHRSDDRGDSWTTISGDLSRARQRHGLEIMGRVWSVDAMWDLRAMSAHANITSISESPVVEHLIYVGTDDGLIQVTEDGGENWRRVDRIFGVPEFAFVNDIKADRHDADTVYACLDNHKEGDYSPYLIKSTDRGRTWSSLAGDLPYRHLVWRLEQDHVKANLLFLGTEFGVFTSLNAGENWIKLGGMPTIPARDLAIQKRENDLVAATFGRGFYVLDDYSPLRELSDELLEKDSHFFPIKKALLYIPRDRLGGLKGSQGDSLYNAPNPPYGAVFTFHLKDSLKTAKAVRQEKESRIKSAGGDNSPPDFAALKQEGREEAPSVYFEIRDSADNMVERIPGPSRKGIHRVVWGLRYAGFTAGGGGGRFRRGGGGGPMVTPGTYSVRAFKQVGDETTALGDAAEFEVEAVVDPALPRQDRAEVLAFQMEIGKLQGAMSATQGVLGTALAEVQAIKGLKLDSALRGETRALEIKLLDAQEKLTGDFTPRQYSEPGYPSIMSRLQNALFGTMSQTYGVTGTQRRQYEIAQEEYTIAIGDIRELIENEVEALKAKADAAGLPWTPGRKIPGGGN